MTFSYLGSFLVMTLLVVGVAVPTPGQVGGFQAAYKIAVTTFFGAPDDAATAGGDRALRDLVRAGDAARPGVHGA